MLRSGRLYGKGRAAADIVAPLDSCPLHQSATSAFSSRIGRTEAGGPRRTRVARVVPSRAHGPRRAVAPGPEVERVKRSSKRRQRAGETQSRCHNRGSCKCGGLWRARKGIRGDHEEWLLPIVKTHHARRLHAKNGRRQGSALLRRAQGDSGNTPSRVDPNQAPDQRLSSIQPDLPPTDDAGLHQRTGRSFQMIGYSWPITIPCTLSPSLRT